MKNHFFGPGIKRAFLASIIMTIAACTTARAPAPVTQKTGPVVVHDEKLRREKIREKYLTEKENTGNTLTQTRKGLPDAVSAPLKDLNLKKPIPPDYLESLGYVYTADRKLNCREIARQITVLNSALGETDTDVLIAEEIALRQNTASETTLDVVGSIARSIIPLRPVVRTVTGARKAKKHYEERFDNGRRRRAFLKGYGLAKRCKPPAAPLVTYAPYWGKEKPVDPNAPNKSWDNSHVPPAGK